MFSPFIIYDHKLEFSYSRSWSWLKGGMIVSQWRKIGTQVFSGKLLSCSNNRLLSSSSLGPEDIIGNNHFCDLQTDILSTFQPYNHSTFRPSNLSFVSFYNFFTSSIILETRETSKSLQNGRVTFSLLTHSAVCHTLIICISSSTEDGTSSYGSRWRHC